MSVKRLRRSATAVAAGALATALALPATAATALAADAAPAAAQLPATVSADSLPTVQVNGVVWNQLVVGNTVYVAGEFTSARPAGAPAGTSEVARTNLLAYDITTGSLISSWAPTVNGTAYGLAASADGKKVYVSGSFTQANGQTQYRLAAFDATSGALVSGFKPVFDARVRSIAVVGDTLYAGGIFTRVGSTPRIRLAALNATTGALVTGWNASADAEVLAMVVPSSTPELVIAGRFGTVNGTASRGSGALSLDTGASLPWAVQEQVYDYGPSSAVYSLSTDGTAVFATGYNFGDYGNFENSFAAEANGGALRWANSCLGDTYGSHPLNGVLYTAGHAHDCSTMGGLPDLAPRQYQWALAGTTAASGRTNPRNAYGWLEGTPQNTQLHWTPTFNAGSYTGQGQSTWDVTGNQTYIVYGGEFTNVNGKGQQGLARFAVRSSAPGKEGPQGGSDLTPSATATYPGQVRLAWRSAWDRDDKTLTYELLRGSATNPTVVATTTASTEWWDRPPLALADPSPLAGAQQYRVRVTDPSGNTVTGSPVSATVSTTAASAYPAAVKQDGATDYWRLGDRTGLVGTASIGEHDLKVDSSETRGTAGATADGNTAMTFTGVTEIPFTTRFGPSYKSVVPAATTYTLDGPQTYTTEAWINTTTTSGGKIIGFGNSNSGYSSNYDRQVYMTNDGRLVAGVYNGGINTAASTKTYNDGQWHHVVSTLGASGLSLYVDGVKVAVNSAATQAQPFNGYWRIGGDNLNYWPDQPTSAGFAGAIDDVAVYPTALTGAQVRAHYAATGRTAAVTPAPSDAYGKSVYGSDPQFFWRGDGVTGTTVADAGPNGVTGVEHGGVSAAPGVPGIGGNGFGLNGTDAYLVEAQGHDRPQQYSAELWFSSTSTRGGKLIGTGNANNDYSWSNDRNVTLQDDGRLSVNVWTGQENRYTTTAAYNDGTWHHVVLTQGSAGIRLYVDGAVVISNAQTGNEAGYGYWRVGGDTTWAGTSTSRHVAATIDQVAVYDRPLSADEVTAHFAAAGGNVPPTAVFTPTTNGLALGVDASASTDTDGIASYRWTFGDGATATGATAQHTYAKAGTYAVALTTTDTKGATTTAQQSVTVRSTSDAPADAYGAAVYAAGPDAYYRLDAAAGATSAADSSGLGNTGVLHGGVRTGAPGVSSTVGAGTGATLDGQVGTTIVDPQRLDGPTTYSLEMWFSTTSTRGGKLIGFGDGDGTGYSGNYDRHVIMNTDGTLHFGVWTGQENRVDTSAAYNDGKWHHVVATQGPAGMVLYVDGTSVGTNGQTRAQAYSGYWRVGGDSSWGPTQNGFLDGSVDEVAIYSTVLPASAVADHFAKGAAPANQAPTAAFTAAATGLSAAFDASASKDADGSVASYAWDFGDGAKGTGATATHAYATAGTYTATLVVTDDKGATGTATRQVVVSAPAPANQAPTAAFSVTAADLSASFDASASADADGTVASYAWDFGDGTTGTGRTASHTYATAGTRTATLVVTDDKGATATVSHPVSVTAPAPANQAPTASFTATAKDLSVALDASASADSDGAVASYAWDFGDQTTGTGRTASHTYAAAGTYQVKLTVTDDKGAAGSLTQEVVVTAPVAANKPPTASFTSSATGLAASLDASASSDPDGAVASYAWDFGDQTSGTGRTASHTYKAAGTYAVVLTVTDDKGATASLTRSVVVAPATPPTAALAADSFSRTVSSGWGSADTGGAWTAPSGSSSVDGSAGRLVMGKPGVTTGASLAGVSSSDTDLLAVVSLDKAATGGGTYVSLVGRRTTAGDYRAKVKVGADGAVTLSLTRTSGSTETSLRAVVLNGVTIGAGQKLAVRVQVVGTGTTSLSAKAWAAGSAEPTSWAVSATDTTAELQGAGSIGVIGYLSGSATNAPVSLLVDELSATTTGRQAV
ncbi:PKD domain-containing protein [Quadrisphaera oryzae]|uniref:PKD domain-containing protein n=1 Tax=Quadrisphaera TaxID=317661 RepID=UPI001646C3EF|nr:PKD domain-containing protein [Quadrisphaera sp. RL12-1S]MBC3761667.1 PKD domain-containing protein [Quadrisphaera sp. RL12-1S]